MREKRQYTCFLESSSLDPHGPCPRLVHSFIQGVIFVLGSSPASFVLGSLIPVMIDYIFKRYLGFGCS